MSKYLYSLGLMSGTSVDGVDASIIKSDGEQSLEIIDDIYVKYDDHFRMKLKKTIDSCYSKDEFNSQLQEFQRHLVSKHDRAKTEIERDVLFSLKYEGDSR